MVRPVQRHRGRTLDGHRIGSSRMRSMFIPPAALGGETGGGHVNLFWSDRLAGMPLSKQDSTLAMGCQDRLRRIIARRQIYLERLESIPSSRSRIRLRDRLPALRFRFDLVAVAESVEGLRGPADHSSY